ncbi:MAG: PPOX class F420-dependent oxidoreductase [Candidatus Hodarchaeales archaeon]
MTIEEKLSQFSNILSTKAFAHLSTIMPDGSPHTTPVWFSMENNIFIINTAIGRVKDWNMKKNPKVALSILDPLNPYSYIGVQGIVLERTENGADDHINSLSKKYLDADEYPYRSPNEVRIVYRIKPIAIYGM